MGANTTPIFTREGVIGHAQATVINTGRDGTGTLVNVATGAADGTRITLIRLKAIVTTTAGMIRLFLDDGTNVRLWKELVVTAVTVGASTPAYSLEFEPTVPLILPGITDILKAGTEKAEAMNIWAHGANF